MMQIQHLLTYCIKPSPIFAIVANPILPTAHLQDAVFGKDEYGIVSCYNSLPQSGGGSTLVRINLKEVAQRSQNSSDFLNNVLPFLYAKTD